MSKPLLRIKCGNIILDKIGPGPHGTHILIWLLQLLVSQQPSPESCVHSHFYPPPFQRSLRISTIMRTPSHRLPVELPHHPEFKGKWTQITWVLGQDDAHQRTTHLTCYCSGWRRRLPGKPTSLGIWCQWSWCIDRQGQTCNRVERACLSVLGAWVPFLRLCWGASPPHITLSSQSPTPWRLGFLPLNNFGQPGEETDQQKCE